LRSGERKATLSFAEATRWLLYFNGFAETFGKLEAKGKTSKTDISIGVGWLGKLGLISAVGDNLFQTLMLNFTLLNMDRDVWETGKPIWEKPVNYKERNVITLSYSQSELLTLQSRRVLLERNGNRVVSFRFVSGDIFSPENAFSEMMTTWYKPKPKAGKLESYSPKRFLPSVQLWRDFASLVSQSNGNGHTRPGVVWWLDYLIGKGKLAYDFPLLFHTSGILYGTMQSVIADVFADSISFNAGLLLALNSDWVTRIISMLSITDLLVKEVGVFAQRLAIAAGIKDGKQSGIDDGAKYREEAKTQAYYRLDMPFRHWLESIDPGKTVDMDVKCDEWWLTSQRIVRVLGRELLDNCSSKAYIGRGDISALNDYNWFIYNTVNRETLKKRGEDKRGKRSKGTGTAAEACKNTNKNTSA
jgi:CRISPR system Cascade subunit CasA